MPRAIILGSITCNKNAFSVVWITLSHLMIYTLCLVNYYFPPHFLSLSLFTRIFLLKLLFFVDNLYEPTLTLNPRPQKERGGGPNRST